MDDLISRQAAIDALGHMMDTDGFRDGWAVSRANVDCMLRALPSAHPEQRWIPCSERLPDKCQMVIIWLSIPKQPFEKRSMHMAMAWLEPDARTGELHWMDRHFSKIMDEKVVAWMPLPEPYKEGDLDEQT